MESDGDAHNTEPASQFDRYSESYRAEVQKAIGFLGRSVEFFAQAKAKALLNIAASELGPTAGLTVLDVGCGVGLTDRFLVEHVAELHGVDVSAECVRAAQVANPKAAYQSYEGDSLPFPDEHFDISFVFNVIHHVHMPNRVGLISEMSRVTRRRGLVIVIEQNPLNPVTRLAVHRCSFDDGCELAQRRAVEALFREADCELVETRYIMFLPWASPLLTRIERVLRHVPLGAQYVVAGRRRRSSA